MRVRHVDDRRINRNDILYVHVIFDGVLDMPKDIAAVLCEVFKIKKTVA